MTELYISGQRVMLPSNFSFPIIEENPFFTKNGKYTYDITLSLLDPVNARIYQHLNRMNKKGDIPKNRSAYLVVDNEVVLNGTEAILEYSDKDVKIQLLSGNSELNFLIGADKRLRDLDLGKADIPWVSVAERVPIVLEWLKKPYPERNWQLLPYAMDSEDEDRIYGNFYHLLHERTGEGDEAHPDPSKPFSLEYYPFYSGTVPQPYFCFIIQKSIETLGYTLVYNAIANHAILSQSYIVNGFQTLLFNKMLPDWTVSEFLSKIEFQFDCSFIVDERSREVRLFFNYEGINSGINKNKEITITQVLDEYKSEIDTDNKLVVQNSNIEYSLEETNDYYAFMKVNSRIYDKAIKVPFSTYNELMNLIHDENDDDRFKKIFTDGYDEFIAYNISEDENNPLIVAKLINSFKPLYNNPDSTEIDHSFDIIPAPMKYFAFVAFPTWNETYFWLQMPIALEHDPSIIQGQGQIPEEELEEDQFSIQELIEGDISLEETNTISKIRLAIYPGLSLLDLKSTGNPSENKTAYYPICYVESLSEYFTETQYFRWFGPIGNDPFRLKVIDREIYDRSEKIDTTIMYTLSFVYNDIFDITAKFIICNKIFRCVKIEKTITSNGFDELYKGYFYPEL